MTQISTAETTVTGDGFFHEDGQDVWVSPSVAENPVLVLKFEGLEDPGTNTGHVVSVELGKTQPRGVQVDARVELRQGYVSETEKGKLIIKQEVVKLPAEWKPVEVFLSAVQAKKITDYQDLFLRVVCKQG